MQIFFRESEKFSIDDDFRKSIIENKLNEKKFAFPSYNGFSHHFLQILMFLFGFTYYLYFNSSCCLFTLLIEKKTIFLKIIIENKVFFCCC